MRNKLQFVIKLYNISFHYNFNIFVELQKEGGAANASMNIYNDLFFCMHIVVIYQYTYNLYIYVYILCSTVFK